MILPLKRDGVVEKELRSVSKCLGDSMLGEIQVYQARDIGEHEGNVVGCGLGDDGGQKGECTAGGGGHLRDGAVGEDQDGTDGLDVRLDLGLNPLVMDLARPVRDCAYEPAQGCRGCGPWGVVMNTHDVHKYNTDTYHYAVLASKLVNADGVGLALVGRTTLLVRTVENVKRITISAISGENVGEQFQN